MKIKLHHGLLILCLANFCPAGIYCAQAQEGSYSIPDSYEEAEAERDRVIYSPGETEPLANSKVQVSVTRDSAVARPAGALSDQASGESQKNSSKSPASSQDDDSLLSFNFLYYLFEKYKLQDIVD